MSISSEINRIAQNVSDSLTAVASKGATVPSGAKSDNLPSLIASLPSTNTVTYNLTGGASASVTPAKAITGQGFSVKLKAPAGYTLSNVTVTMGGNDITSQVFMPDEQGGGGGGGTYVRTEILAQQTFTGDSSQRRATLTGLTEGFVDGDYYIVTYDGVEWLTTCETLWSTNYCIGEAMWFLSTGDAVYPFGVIWTSGTTATVAAANTSQHSIKIEHLEFVEEGITLGTKNITQNGTYNASSDSADGYSSVTVAVPNSYAAGDEGKVVSNGALVAQTSDTVTQNGTVDTTLISSLVVNVAAGGSSVKTGTVTPSAASTTISFDAGLSTITGILIMPVNTPLTGSRTQAAMVCLPNGSFYKAISIHTNSGGTGWVSPSVYTSNKFTLSGTTVTVTGAYSFRPAVGYIWYAW